MEQQSLFSEPLLQWYRNNKRDLPWRKSRDPYHIWVSEIMLQQTRVDTVIPYYERFIEKFPTVRSLANASEKEVMKAWEGLGYYSRVRNLQSAVREVQEKYNGIVPSNKEELSRLKGIGSYTAGAILSIAFNVPEPAVDGNVMRVLSRFFLIEDDVGKTSTKEKMEQLARDLIPDGQAGDFNQALMELGALICTPKSPACLLCPVMEHCAARREGMEEQLPVKKKGKPPRNEFRLAAWIETFDGGKRKVLISRRPPHGLLANMWELPHFEGSGSKENDEVQMQILKQAIRQCLNLEPVSMEKRMDVRHAFSHIHWHLRVFRCLLEEWKFPNEIKWEREWRWVSKDEISQYTFPNVFLKIFKKMF